MSGFAFSNTGESFFSSIMSGLFNVAIVTVAADALNAKQASAPALTALSVDVKAGFMCCLLSRTLCDAAFVLRNDGDRAGLRDQVQLIQLPPSTFSVCAVM